MIGREVIPFHLRRSVGQHVDVHRRRGSIASIRTQRRRHVRNVVDIRVRRRHIGRTDLGDRGGSRHGLGRRWHHTCTVGTIRIQVASRSSSGQVVLLVSLVAPSRVRVVVNARVAGELVGAAEAFRAAGELAGVRFLTGVRPDVSSLMLQSMERTVTERTFVRTRQFGTLFLCGRSGGSFSCSCGSDGGLRALDQGRQRGRCGRGHFGRTVSTFGGWIQ